LSSAHTYETVRTRPQVATTFSSTATLSDSPTTPTAITAVNTRPSYMHCSAPPAWGRDVPCTRNALQGSCVSGLQAVVHGVVRRVHCERECLQLRWERRRQGLGVRVRRVGDRLSEDAWQRQLRGRLNNNNNNYRMALLTHLCGAWLLWSFLLCKVTAQCSSDQVEQGGVCFSSARDLVSCNSLSRHNAPAVSACPWRQVCRRRS